MKKYLLIAGFSYYPQSGTSDWRGCFETREEAESRVEKREVLEFFRQGPRKGKIKERRTCFYIEESEIDWYEIIDLEEWMRY